MLVSCVVLSQNCKDTKVFSYIENRPQLPGKRRNGSSNVFGTMTFDDVAWHILRADVVGLVVTTKTLKKE